MAKDIGLKFNESTSSFTIIDQKNSVIPQELQSAITLLFLSQESILRGSFDGIYNIVGKFNNDTKEEIEMELADISFNLTKSLQDTYPYVKNTQFSVDIDDNYINIDLTVNTQEDSMKTTVYSNLQVTS